MEARVQRFYQLGQLGRPYRVFNLVILELQYLAHMKNRRKAAYAAHMAASFYDLPELDPWQKLKQSPSAKRR